MKLAVRGDRQKILYHSLGLVGVQYTNPLVELARSYGGLPLRSASCRELRWPMIVPSKKNVMLLIPPL